MIPLLHAISNRDLGFFRFKKMAGSFLLTNDVGEYYFLDPTEFNILLSDKAKKGLAEKYSELQKRGFTGKHASFGAMSKKYALKNHVGQGAGLHIIIVTLRCDHKCIYCQAITVSPKNKDLDMQIPIARQTVDKILLSPNNNITIEFQGGEPLLNFDIVKFITLYALKKNKKAKKNLSFCLVSNLTFMTREKLKFINKNNIQICTSLDGPEKIHNKCRISSQNKNSHKNTVKWFKILQKESGKKRRSSKPSALSTITRFSLAHPRQIIDAYIELGLDSIHLRPLSPFGVLSEKRKTLNYSATEFLTFYRKAVDYIISMNLSGKNFSERTAKIFLTKILSDINPGYLDIQSPCGAGIGQLAYNYNGDIYTCDEGRMLSRLGDESFKIGNVSDFSYQKLADNQLLRAVCSASCLDIIPGCSDCVFKPYCGVCPVYNHKINEDIFSKAPFLCHVHEGIMQFLFEKLKNEKIKEIFHNWIRHN